MVEYKQGNILDNAIGILVYPVNTRGAMEDEMGTQLKAMYPKVFQAYSHACNSSRRDSLGGKADLVSLNSRMHIALAYVRTRNYGERVDYYLLRQALTAVRDNADRRHLPVCIPMFGTEREQTTIRSIMQDIFRESSIVLTVWESDHQIIGLPPSAEGDENANWYRRPPRTDDNRSHDGIQGNRDSGGGYNRDNRQSGDSWNYSNRNNFGRDSNRDNRNPSGDGNRSDNREFKRDNGQDPSRTPNQYSNRNDNRGNYNQNHSNNYRNNPNRPQQGRAGDSQAKPQQQLQQ